MTFLEISQISPQRQKLNFRKLVQIIAKGQNNCGNIQKDFTGTLQHVKNNKIKISQTELSKSLE
jgi:hypothetical protein